MQLFLLFWKLGLFLMFLVSGWGGVCGSVFVCIKECGEDGLHVLVCISLASRLLIILKSLNTNRIQVQAQLSHTRPTCILFDMPTLALSRTVRNVNIYSRPINTEITAQKNL